MPKLVRDLVAASIERQVEDAYNEALKAAFPGAKIEYPFGCDGYMEFESGGMKHRLIVEYKYDEDMSSKAVRSKVLAQVVFYLKKFELAGRPLPDVVLVADRNECFVLHSNDLVKWLDFEGVDWAQAPSKAHEKAPALVLALAEDETRNAFVFDVGEGFDFAEVAGKIRGMASGTVRRVRVTEHNVDKVFGVFAKKVLLEKKMTPNDQVALFFAVVTGDEGVFPHGNVLVSGAARYRISAGNYEAFCRHFQTKCSPREKARLAAVADRLLEDARRRRQGAFFTPTPFAAEGHCRMEAAWGADVREKAVFWDPAAGTLNLERDWRFGELYCSTLEQAELDIAKAYCPGAAKFQLDFLNDEIRRVSEGGKVPDALVDALEAGRTVVFLVNPPYATSAVKGAKGKAKAGTGKTLMNVRMKAVRMGQPSEQLYAQFLWRVMEIKRQYRLADVRIALYCKPNFMTGGAFERFRAEFLREFKYESGMLFNAGHFDDTAATWGISFSLWSSGETVDKTSFPHDLVDLDDDGEVEVEGTKTLYNIDGKITVGDWVKQDVPRETEIHVPLKSAISVGEEHRGDTWAKDSIGWLMNCGNNVSRNGQDVGLFTAPFAPKKSSGVSVIKDNFGRACAAFATRRLVKGDWVNDKDEYSAPDETNPNYKQFADDALVFSLFDSNSQQSSLRGVEYKGRPWDVKNEFAFVPAKDVEDWADEAGLEGTYEEARALGDSFMVKALAAASLSDEARAVLEKARELTHKAMKYRKLFDEARPEAQVLRADAGWYQVKLVLKEYMPEELKAFRGLFRKLADKMRPMVYQLGFLRK